MPSMSLERSTRRKAYFPCRTLSLLSSSFAFLPLQHDGLHGRHCEQRRRPRQCKPNRRGEKRERTRVFSLALCLAFCPSLRLSLPMCCCRVRSAATALPRRESRGDTETVRKRERERKSFSLTLSDGSFFSSLSLSLSLFLSFFARAFSCTRGFQCTAAHPPPAAVRFGRCANQMPALSFRKHSSFSCFPFRPLSLFLSHCMNAACALPLSLSLFLSRHFFLSDVFVSRLWSFPLLSFLCALSVKFRLLQ